MSIWALLALISFADTSVVEAKPFSDYLFSPDLPALGVALDWWPDLDGQIIKNIGRQWRARPDIIFPNMKHLP